MTTILFIDDDITTLELMEKAVAVLGHYTLTSSSPHAAIELARQRHPDVILVDRQLHTMDGCSLVEQIHHTLDLKEIPVYLVSAYLSAEDTESAELAGAVGCLEKPLSLADLSQILTQAAGQATGE